MSYQHQHKLSILISGAGIAGLTAAHFLSRAGHEVTIIERAPALRASGQSVDVRGHALTILKRIVTERYNAEEAVLAKRTQEKGLRFVNAANRTRAEFPVDNGSSFTGEIEIMRGDLALALYESINNLSNVQVLFGRTISSLQDEDDGKVQISLTGGWPSSPSPRSFDMIIAADGIASSTRRLTFPDSSEEAVKPLGQWSCWFSIPRKESDDLWARWYNAANGRMILCGRIWSSGTEEQTQFWATLFHDAGWEATRVVDGLRTADDFYMQRIAQVKTDSWSSGRVVLVGDAGYCPSPVSGMGVTTAMTGAYVLAGEVNQNPHDIMTAFKTYEEKMRPFVKVAQQLAPGTPGAANPDSVWGIWLLYSFLGFISWTGLYKMFGFGVNPPSQAMELPTYDT